MADRRPSENTENNSISKGLNAFRELFVSKCEDIGIPHNSGAVEKLDKEGIRDLALSMLHALVELSSTSLLNSNSHHSEMHSNLLKLNSTIGSDDYDLNSIKPVLKAGIDGKSDSEIWDRIRGALPEASSSGALSHAGSLLGADNRQNGTQPENQTRYTEEAKLMSPPSFTGLGTVGIGLSSAVLRLDAVAKCYFGRNIEDREREIAVLKRLGADGYKRNKNIVRWYGVLDGCILLQRAHHGSIRQYYLQYDPHRPPLSTQLQWAEQATDAICFLHSKGVVHCDISCNNIFIDDNLDAIVGDFAGSSIDGNQKCPLYETSHCHPDQKVSSEISDIFALGSTFYEMLVGRKPYDGMEHREIEEAIRNGNFPSLESLPALKTIILDCWNGRYKAATELLEDVRKEGIYSPIAKLAF